MIGRKANEMGVVGFDEGNHGGLNVAVESLFAWGEPFAIVILL